MKLYMKTLVASALATLSDAAEAPFTIPNAANVVLKYSPTPSPKPSDEALSPREAEVLNYLVKGFSYKETAEAMGISYSTVHSHIEHIYDKLHVQSRAQAVARYLGF
jgi:DNA-binding NarL/FixJ family response regulator